MFEQTVEHPFTRLPVLFAATDTAEDVPPVALLPHHVQGQQRHEAGDLHEEVHEERHPGVESEGPDRRHVRESAQEEAGGLADRGEQHRWGDLPHHPAHMLSVGLILLAGLSLVSLNQDEDIVNTDSEDEEGNDLKDDEGCWDSDEPECSDAGGHREEDNHDTSETECDLALDHEHGDLAFIDLTQAKRDVHEHDDVRNG